MKSDGNVWNGMQKDVNVWNILHTNYYVSVERECFVYENITSYFKNHWTKHRLICTSAPQSKNAVST